LDSLQQDIDAAHPILEIDIVGINEVGHESANSLMTADRSRPWLQDVDANGNQSSDVWNDLWNVTYREVVILDGSNTVVEAFNLTENNLANPDDYAALRTKLIDAAMADQKPWQNPTNQHDTNKDGFVVPLDVLVQINSINEEGARELAAPTGTEVPAYYDCNGDGWLSSIDALQVINYMDEVRAAGEGAPSEESTSTRLTWLPTVSEPLARSSDAIESTVGSMEQTVIQEEPIVAPPAHEENVSSVKDETQTIETADEYWASYWNTQSSFLELDAGF
jgi:hypothetical protein